MRQTRAAMKKRLDRLGKLGIVLALSASLVGAQTSSPAKSPAKTKSAPKATIQTPQPEELREQQIRMFREHILTRTLDSIKKMDEAALRLSARNQVLAYLSEYKTQSQEDHELTRQIALEAVAELNEHGDEILPFMADYLSNDLGAWIQKYQPDLTEKFQKAVKVRKNVNESQLVRSLFELKDGDVLAAQRIRQLMEERDSLEGIFFWLDELMRRNSRELEPLMAQIVVRGGEGQLSFETLLWVSQIYLRPQISATLKSRFLAMVVARTQMATFVVEPPPQTAYELLSSLLPSIQQITPELYDQALTQAFAIRASFTERQSATEARNKRLSESVDPVGDLVRDAEAAKSKADRNELLAEAAQLALRKNKFDVSLDIVARVDFEVRAPHPDYWRRWGDQFLKNVVKMALAANDPELAENAAGRIASSLSRVEALTLIMRQRVKANDPVATETLLTEASKVAAAASDDAEKAKAFFLLSLAADLAAASKKAELLLSGIRVLNNLPMPANTSDQKKSNQERVRSLDNAGYELTKGFRGLTKKDENGALALVDKLNKPDFRTFALIGILLGLDSLLPTTKSESKVSSTLPQ